MIITLKTKKNVLKIKKVMLKKSFKLKRKNHIGSNSPSEIKYMELCEKYGKPTIGGIDGEPHINAYGIAVFPEGAQFVHDCVTGRITLRTPETRYLGTTKGLHFYLSEGSEYTGQTEAIPSFPEKNIEEDQ